MIRVQVVEARAAVGQTAVADIGLPDRIGAPQALLGRDGVEAVGFGQFSCFVGFGHQALLAIQEVGGLACSFLDAL